VVRLSTYVVTRRLPPRAANDNRSKRSTHRWQWALMVGIAPALTALLLLSGVF